MDLSRYGELFLAEAREHVSQVNHHLLALEKDPADRGSIEGIFRSVHTIKGMAATLGFAGVADLAHEMENLLDLVRGGAVVPDAELVDLLFSAADGLEGGVEASVEGEDATGADPSLLIALRTAANLPVADASDEPAEMPVATSAAGRDEERVGSAVEVRMSSDAVLAGVRAFMVLQRARSLGDVSAVEPPEAEIQAERFTGTFRFRIRTDASPEAVRAALLQVGDVAEIRLGEPADEAVGAAGAAPHEEAAPIKHARRARSIRVDLRRLDTLMNQVGELVIVRDRMQKVAAEQGDVEIGESVEEASRLIAEVQREVMDARLVPVWQILDRFPRLVRDAARTLGKKVDLVIEGREIEFDRSMLDEIGDPLVHLLRNSVDHGIETPEERRAAGKPERGQVRIEVAREQSRVMVRVRDDGCGIDRDRILRVAEARGMLPAGEGDSLSDDELFRLLTTPGFSTASEVTDVSGRGVGLDVVSTRVRALGGTLAIASTPRRGTTFTVGLPLTLAIIRALLVRSGGQTYALPLNHVAETVALRPDGIERAGGRWVTRHGSELLPLVSLADALGTPESREEDTISIVILEMGDRRTGLTVDDLLGQREIVVKSFDATRAMPPLFSGATVLADGRPALILDAGGLALHATAERTA